MKIGSIVRYYDKKRQTHIEARVEEMQPFNEVFQDSKDDGLYLYLDNDMCVHEDLVKLVQE